MNSQLVDEASKVVPEIPLLINMVSKRVRQLNAGARPMIADTSRMDAADIALAEIIGGKLHVRRPDAGEDSE